MVLCCCYCLVIIIISSKYSYHENFQLALSSYLWKWKEQQKAEQWKCLYLYKVNRYLIKWFIHSLCTEGCLNVCLMYLGFLSCSTSHSARFLIPVDGVLHHVPAVQLQQGWLGPSSLLTLSTHHCSQSWEIKRVLSNHIAQSLSSASIPVVRMLMIPSMFQSQ